MKKTMLDQSMLYHFGDSYKELKYGWSIVDDSPIPTIVDCTIGFPVSSLSPNSLKEVTLPNHGFFEQLKYTGGKNKPEDIGVVKKSCKTYWVSKPLYASVHPNMA